MQIKGKRAWVCPDFEFFSIKTRASKLYRLSNQKIQCCQKPASGAVKPEAYNPEWVSCMLSCIKNPQTNLYKVHDNSDRDEPSSWKLREGDCKPYSCCCCCCCCCFQPFAKRPRDEGRKTIDSVPRLGVALKYRKIPKISPGAYIFQRPLLRGLFLEGLIFGGAYLRRETCVSKSIGLAL